MLSTLDILYLVGAFCLIIITGVLVVLGIEIIRVLQDVRRMSRNLEQITALLERISQIVFPGIERLAHRAGRMEEKVATFLEKKVDNLTK